MKFKTTTVREKVREDEELFVLSGRNDNDSEEDDGRRKEEEEEEEEEEDDQQAASHAQLLSDIMKMSKKNKVQQAVRTSLGAATHNTSHLLTRVLPSAALNKHTHTLPVPVEKTVAKRINRAAGYENVAMEVNRWAKVVKVRREAEQLHFPLRNSDTSLAVVDKTEEIQMRKPLEQEVYALLQDAKLVQTNKETEEEIGARKALSLQEIRERNRELWRQKEMKRRYEQKARLMNKSKSRKHHRILRRERLRKQRAELEELQKTDPEAALERLQELERARIEERMSLRHKTSKWAHLQGFRANTDKNAMAALRENQRMHRELTAKTDKPIQDENDEDLPSNDDDDDDKVEGEGDVLGGGKSESSNPWVKHLTRAAPAKNTPAQDESFTRFKKFWEEVNKRKEADRQIEERMERERQETVEGETKEIEKEEEMQEEDNREEETEKIEKGKEANKKSNNNKQKLKKCKQQEKLKSGKTESKDSEEKVVKESAKKKKKKKKKQRVEIKNQEAMSIDELFDEVEIGIQKKVQKKLEKLGVNNKQQWTEVKKKGKKNKAAETSAPSEIEEFDFTSTRTQENIDEKRERAGTLEALESLEEGSVDPMAAAVNTLKKPGTPQGTPTPQKAKAQVDPNKFLQVEAKQLITALPTSVGEEGEAMDDLDKEETAEDIIREAFADDYLMEEFSSEKAEAVKKDQPVGMSLALPGWGDWTGPNIKMSKRKLRKFSVRIPRSQRKDSNIGNVLYNEKADVHSNLRKAMVSELPYPFKGVKDFEASVRAPIGRLFVPEGVHKRMTAPPLITRMSAVIQPMTEEELLLRHDTSDKESTKTNNNNNNNNKSRGDNRGTKRKGTGGKPGQQNSKRKVR